MPSFRRRLACYLGAMVILHAVVFYGQWKYIRAGLPDFTIFYTAGKILDAGRAAQLYDDDLQRAIQQPISMTVKNGGTILPFNHPPFEALVFAPVAELPYQTAYIVWFVVDFAIIAASIALLRRHTLALAKLPFWIWLLAAVGFPPLFVALMHGQDVIWVLFCYVAAYVALSHRNDFKAGAWLGLGLCKFHLILPFIFAFLAQNRRKVLAGFFLTALILTVVGFAVVGVRTALDYPLYVWRAEHNAQYAWATDHSNNPNLRGLIVYFLPGGMPRLSTAIVIGISVCVLLSAAYIWKQLRSWGPEGDKLGFAVNVIATVLVSYHTWVQDLSLLLLPVVIVLDVLLTNPQLASRLRRTLWFSAALLFCSPVYLVLLLRYRKFSLMTIAVLIFAAALLAMIRALKNRTRVELGFPAAEAVRN